MNRKEKQAYLNQYQRALKEYKILKSNLESTHSIDYNHVKSTVHKTLGAKIQELDEAHTRVIAVSYTHLGVTTLIVCHTNKKNDVSARGRISDSSDIWDIARNVFIVGHTGEDDIRYLSHDKCNVAKLQDT